MKGNDVSLVVTYNPNFKNLNFLIRKNLQFLYICIYKIKIRTIIKGERG